ncbi:MAG: hydrogenobyrinic acid a,c-diamide synthase (glutamine-hydrolyzing) [Candidatus Methanoperedens sp.]|nr:hydrogenobyrinic acid a,c-diamide synthase (glutamine-hydrolyzing) [Candidatus Methanoperedens sp.]
MTNIPTILVAGTGSGVGKTTVALGLMAALCRKYRVQPFKVGPDFIDPGHHTKVCGRTSRNLDSYIMGEKGIIETFARASEGVDFCVIEGVMGLYDGLDATEIASTAHVAKILDVPVILVVDARGVSRSIAAVVKGFSEFDAVSIQGIILNNAGSERHVKLVRDSLSGAKIKIPVLGALPKNTELLIPSRHLGLYMASENDLDAELLSGFIEKHIDLEAVKNIAKTYTAPEIELKEPDVTFKVKVGIAQDSAFCFYYQDSLDSLKRMGADLVFFSPMSDDLPQVDGIYLGGGYPELYAKELESSRTREEIKKAADSGVPIYGECGALMYLNESLTTDRTYRMAGILGAHSRMTDKLQGLGYTEAQVVSDSLLAKKGAMIRGHEFHYSVTDCDRDACFAYNMKRGKGIVDGKDGIMEHNTLASYMHTHPAAVTFAEFLQLCERNRV